MPCKSSKARKLLKDGKAIVKKTEPFIIQLKYGSFGYKQKISLGIDAGCKYIGLSASTKKAELYSSEVELRSDITNKLANRSQYRRKRRYRKTRYRQARYLNRTKSKHKGWFAPSIENKMNVHLKVVNEIHKLLPVSNIVVEVGNFDIQKMQNPDIKGVEYQKGEQYGFWNIREYIFWRDNYCCTNCKCKSGDKTLTVHHLESRKTGGNAPNNLITLCHKCHKEYHNGLIELNIKRGRSYRDAQHMNAMKNKLYNLLMQRYGNVSVTYGYITKCTRINNNIQKGHCHDAYCIANNLNATMLNYYYYQKQVRTKNRQLYKANPTKGGKMRLNQSPKYVMGYQLFDKISLNGEKYYIFGRRLRGDFDIKKLSNSDNNRSVRYKKIRLIESRRSILTELVKRNIIK